MPVREDLATPESWSKPISTRGAIEEMPEGCIAVADAMGVDSAGIFGDILTMRMMRRGVAALVTDGVVRDKVGVLASALPVWCAGVAAPASVNGLTFVGWQEPIGCGGCAIFPGDVIVADEDGAVVIPQDLVDFVANDGEEHERMETFIVSEVEKGAKLPGLYPMNDETKVALRGVEEEKLNRRRLRLRFDADVFHPFQSPRLLRHPVQSGDRCSGSAGSLLLALALCARRLAPHDRRA